MFGEPRMVEESLATGKTPVWNARSIATPNDKINLGEGPAGEDSVEIVTKIEAFKALQHDWDDLCARSNYRFSQGFAWCWSTWEALHRRRRRRLHCIVIRRGGRFVLVRPFVVYRRSFGTVAAPLGFAYGDYPDPLVENGPEANRRIEAAWRALRDTCRCDIIRLRHVLKGSDLHRLMVRERAKPVSRATNLKVEWHGHADWESYYRSTKGRNRQDTERRRRRLGERGKVSFEMIEGPQCAPAIDWTLTNKVKLFTQANRHAGGWLKSKAYRNVWIWSAARGDPRGRVLVFALKLDGQIIATQLCRVDEIRVEAVESAYDEAYNRYGPGTILKSDCLKWAFERGLEFDFRNGRHTHKERWVNRARSAITYEVPNSKLFALRDWFPVLTPLIHRVRPAQRRIDRWNMSSWGRNPRRTA